MLTRVKNFLKDNRARLPFAALIVGFIWDSITLGRPDKLFDNAVLIFYLILSGVAIILINRYRERDVAAPLLLLIVLQFSFGNLASALFILYGVSGTLAGNWPFLLLLLAFVVGNEFLRTRYARTLINLVIYYIFLFSYVALIVPVLLKDLGAGIFILSSFVSVLLFVFFISILRLFTPKFVGKSKRHMFTATLGILLGMNALYFLNFIPPVPLALRDIGIYHYVERAEGGSYRVMYEAPRWFEFFKKSDRTFHFNSAMSAYCYSSVFAPSELAAPIYHRWEYYDDGNRKWKTITRIAFPIVGGRDGGYRGFSQKDSLTEGVWRCSVETGRGQVIGFRSFKAVSVSSPPELVSSTQ